MAGRPPKEKSFAAALNIAIKEARKDGKEGNKLRQIAEVLVEKAIEGDMQAIKEIGDRIDGKAVTQIAGDIENPLEMVHRIERTIVRAHTES